MLQSCFLNRSWFISFKRTLVSFLVFFVILAASQEFQVRGGSSSSPIKKNQSLGRQTTSSPFVSSRNQEQDDVSTKEMIDAVLTRASKNSLIARVYAIKSGQLIIMALSWVLFGLDPVRFNLWRILPTYVNPSSLGATMFAVSIIVYAVYGTIMGANPQARRRTPTKWWLLGMFTMGEAVLVGLLSSFSCFSFQSRSVVMAMVATAMASITVSAYTISENNPNRDFSHWGAILNSWAMILLTHLVIGAFQELGLVSVFLPFSDMSHSLRMSCCLSLLSALYIKSIVENPKNKLPKYGMNDQDDVFVAILSHWIKILIIWGYVNISSQKITIFFIDLFLSNLKER